MKTLKRAKPARLRWLRLAAMVALALLLVATGVAASSGLGRAQPSPSATARQIATPTLAGDDDQILNPFPRPVMDTTTAAIQAALVAYMSSPQREPIVVPNTSALLFLPSIRTARTPAPFPVPTPTPTPRPAKRADLALTIWPAPSIIVIRGQLLTYELRMKNYGQGEATRAVITLPYNAQELTVVDSRFNDSRDWVSKVAADYVEVTFGRLDEDEYRTAAIIFRVNESLADRTVISMRATYSWSDHRSGGAWRSNWAPVVIGAGNESAPWVPLLVDPLGGYPGTTHHFYTDRFIPGEGIYTWLNTPGGVEPLALRGVADALGRVWLDFRSTDLRPGTYQLVTYGARSNLTGVATFYVW